MCCWTQGGEGVSSTIWWTRRARGLRRGPGYLPGIFWIHFSSRNSIEPDPTDQRHDHGGGHVELQESLLEGGFCNAKPAEGALTRILTVLHSLCFSSHFLFGTFISMLAFWDHAKYCQYYCLTECLSCIQFAFLCMILPVYLTTIILDLPFWCDCLTNLMFVFGPFACLLVSVYWINPVLVDGLDCYTGIDPLPEFTFLPVESLLNKLLLMDSNSASAASLHFLKIKYIEKKSYWHDFSLFLK